MRQIRRCAGAALAALLAISCCSQMARADATFPSHPVRIIVPMPPAGGSDVSGRILAKQLSQATGEPFIVENRPGGNQAIGANVALNSPPDGYTLFLGSNASMAANVSLFKNLGYDPIKDFTPIALVIRARWVLVVGDTSPYTTIDALVAAAKKAPDTLSTADGSAGFQMASALFAKGAGIQINHIPYKGPPDALQDVIAGRVSMMSVDLSTALPLIQSGKLRPLLVLTDKPLEQLPHVPTMKGKGYGSMPLHSWAALFAPAKTPPVVVNRLAVLMNTALHSPAYAHYAASVDSEVTYEGPAATAAFQKEQVESYRNAMPIAGLEPQ